MTEKLYLADATIRAFDAAVVEVVDDADQPGVVLDRTAFYVHGGGQPADHGTLTTPGGAELSVVDVRTIDGRVVHRVDALHGLAVGDVVSATLDWNRRHDLMRTHTAMHVLCGVIWNEFEVAVTGGNMEPLKGRMDFAFDPLPDGFADHITEAVNAAIAADHTIEVSVLDRAAADVDPELIRTKVNLIPAAVTEVRVVDIVGLDRQADGGTHVASTAEVGRFEITKTESKGKGNKRIRFVLHDA